MKEPANGRQGAEILLDCLIRHGVETVFAYPGGATLPIHQALTRVADRVRTILPRHEQGGGFAATGYARASNKPGVVFTTSGPGATNLATCIADAHRHAVPLIAITGQVHHAVLGKDAFQEIPIVAVCRSITKHHYLVTQGEDIPRVVKEAMHVATTGRPGPVIIDIPKDVQARLFDVPMDPAMDLPGYRVHADAKPRAADRGGDQPVHLVLRRLSQLVRERGEIDDTYLTTGVGPERAWLAASYRFSRSANWIDSDSLGAVGFALPAALGVQAARPDARVIAVDGPTGLLANVHELGCAFCEKLPVKVLLLNSAETSWDVDFIQLARGFRIEADRVVKPDSLDDALQEFLDNKNACLLDIQLPCSELLGPPASELVSDPQAV